jgi:E3 ubiquitin-protein ligase ATL41
MFFDGLSYHGAPEASSPNGDRDHGLVVVLTLAIFFCFVVLYLVVGIIWASVVTAFAVALSFCYFRARRRAALRRSTAVVVSVRLASRSNGAGLDHLDPAVLPAFAYKREGGGGDVGAGSGWAQCVICLGLVQLGETVRRLPACKHLFHVDCIDMWLRSHLTCPVCRAVVVELAVGLPSEPPPV